MSHGRILLVAYYFPPLSAAGTHRIIRIARRLPRHGWEPVVLTVGTSSHRTLDRDLLREVEGIETHRTPNWDPGATDVMAPGAPSALRRFLGRAWNRVMPIDGMIGWVPPATRHARHLITQGGFKAVLTTGSPFSAHLIGLGIRRHADIHWLADFRDPWAGSPYRPQPPSWRAWLDDDLERRVVHRADRTILNTPTTLDLYRARYPQLADRFGCIPNGFETGLFAGMERQPSSRFRLVHTGEFYLKRTPQPLLSAFRRWLDTTKVTPNEIELVFVGGLGADDSRQPNERWVQEYHLEDYVTSLPKVSYRASLQHILDADVLLMIGSSLPEDRLFTPSKLFDYLASGRPVLGLVEPAGPAARILEEARLGLVCSPADESAIIEALDRCWRLHRTVELESTFDGRAANLFSADAQCENLAALLSGLPR